MMGSVKPAQKTLCLQNNDRQTGTIWTENVYVFNMSCDKTFIK